MNWKVYSISLMVVATCLFNVSCSSIKWVSVERLAPAKVGVSEQVCRVAVLCSQPQVDNGSTKGGVYALNANIVADSLAQYLANTSFFDEIIVDDTVLATNLFVGYEERELRPTAVAELCRTYGVDMLVMVDYASFVPLGMELPYVAGIVTTHVKCYQCGKLKPIISIHEETELDWGHWSWMRNQALSLAASMALSSIVPHWEIEDLPFYTGANVGQRDAAVSVKENDWEGAADLWRQQLEHKNLNRRLEAHLNMAVFHEVSDNDIILAREYAEKALQLSIEGKEMVDGKLVEPTFDYLFISEYLQDLERRGRNLELLKLQMKRFSNDF